MFQKHRAGSSEPNLGSGKAFREMTFKLKDMKQASSESEGEGPGRGSSMRKGLEVKKIPAVSVCQLENLHHRAQAGENKVLDLMVLWVNCPGIQSGA